MLRSEHHLQNPNPDFLSDLYTRILIALDFFNESEQNQLLQAQVSQLNAEITEFDEAREKELPLLQEADAKVKQLRQTIEGLNNNQVKVRTSLKKLKEKSGEMDKEISDADFYLLKCDSERQELRSRIVQSPDKLQVLKKLSKHLSQMQAIQEQVNSAKIAGKDYKALKDKISDDEILIKSLENEIVKRQAKANDLNELKKKLEKERDLKFEEAAKEFSYVKLEVESRRGVLEARQKDIEAAVAEADSINAKIASVTNSAAADQLALAQKCEELIVFPMPCLALDLPMRIIHHT